MKKRWYDYLWIASLAYLILGFFNILFAWLGLLVVLASAIGTLVVSILKLVYLWRTARTFREYEAA